MIWYHSLRPRWTWARMCTATMPKIIVIMRIRRSTVTVLVVIILWGHILRHCTCHDLGSATILVTCWLSACYNDNIYRYNDIWHDIVINMISLTISCILSKISYNDICHDIVIYIYDIIGPNPSWYPISVSKIHDIPYDIVVFIWYHRPQPFLVPHFSVKIHDIVHDIMNFFTISVVISWSHSVISWSLSVISWSKIWCLGLYHEVCGTCSWHAGPQAARTWAG